MALDPVSELKDAIAAAFSENLSQDTFIQDFLEKAKQKSGALTLEEVQKYAEHLGIAASKALLDVIGEEPLTDESIRREIANQLVRSILARDFDDIQATANKVQKSIDETAGIGLNGVSAALDEGRLSGLVNRFAKSRSIEEARSFLGEPVINFHMHGYDEWVKANAEFRSRSGMEARIVRTAHIGACPWCRILANVYDYGRDVIDKGNTTIFKRHKYCRCTVVFESGKMRQNVWSKRVWKATPQELAFRKIVKQSVTKLSPELAEEVSAMIQRDREVTEEIRNYREWLKEHPNAKRPWWEPDRRTARDRVNRSLKKAEEDAKIASTIAGRLIKDPSIFGTMSPEELKDALEKDGFEVKPLASGRLKGIPFENGGGFKVNFGGTGVIQYHPAKLSHHGGAYYKIATGESGLHRYDTDGTKQPDKPETPKT